MTQRPDKRPGGRARSGQCASWPNLHLFYGILRVCHRLHGSHSFPFHRTGAAICTSSPLHVFLSAQTPPPPAHPRNPHKINTLTHLVHRKQRPDRRAQDGGCQRANCWRIKKAGGRNLRTGPFQLCRGCGTSRSKTAWLCSAEMSQICQYHCGGFRSHRIKATGL